MLHKSRLPLCHLAQLGKNLKQFRKGKHLVLSAQILALVGGVGILNFNSRAQAEVLPLATRLLIAQDMGTNDAFPQGVPSDKAWAKHSRINLGNNPGKFRSILPWAQIFAGPGNSATELHVEVRRLRVLFLYKGEKYWKTSDVSPCVSGAYFDVSYKNNTHRSGPITVPATKICTVVAKPEQALHFWPTSGRTRLEGKEIVGVIAMMDARVAPSDAKTGGRFLLSVGADYWLTQSAQWDHYKTNGDAGIGRLKWLTGDWQTYSMTTLDATQMRATPAAVGSTDG